MNNQIDDKTIILIIIGTILLVFILIFNFIPSKEQFSQPMQWKDQTTQPSDNYNNEF